MIIYFNRLCWALVELTDYKVSEQYTLILKYKHLKAHTGGDAKDWFSKLCIKNIKVLSSQKYISVNSDTLLQNTTKYSFIEDKQISAVRSLADSWFRRIYH